MLDKALERLDKKLESIYDNDKRHRDEASDRVFMACKRTGTDVDYLLDSIEDGTAFDLEKFLSQSEGNFFDFVKPSLLEAVKYFPDITAGGNGGMASIGRGEFAISFLSNFSTSMITEGKGDLRHEDGTYEEVKFNGGKINVDSRRGEDIYKRFKEIVDGKDIKIKGKDFLPFRKNSYKDYSADEIKELNGYYHEAVTGANKGPMSDQDLQQIFLHRAFDNLFKTAGSLLVIDTDGSYVRLKDSDTGTNYYKNLNLDFEIRAWQANPVSLYLFTAKHEKYQKKIVE
jgi:hypothetical protein